MEEELRGKKGDEKTEGGGIQGRMRKMAHDIKRQYQKFQKGSGFFRETESGFQSSFFDDKQAQFNQYGSLKTADRRFNRDIDPMTLRRVAKKAWIINVCINHIQNAIMPYLKPSTSRNLRGFVIHKIGEDLTAADRDGARAKIERFVMQCGTEKDSDRDNFKRFCKKAVRDCMTLDFCATEIGYTKAGAPYAFWYVDAATIEKVLPDQENPYKIKYVQLINDIPTAYYPEGTLIVDFQNPRSDVERSFYGFSLVEQAIDLVTSTINSFVYNAGFFTENKLPRGLLLVDGNMSQENVELMEDYISDIMSGSPTNQWRIPIIPSGGDGDKANGIKWQALGGTNREMEFQNWIDFLTSAIVSLFGCSMEELGLHSSKSQPMFERNAAPEIQASKSAILGNMLAFLQDYINQILEKFFPEYELEFVGYERDDPKAVLEMDKGEVDSYKTLNEKRMEKGLEKIGAAWADVPLNPQAVQMFQAAQAQGGGMDDMGDGADFGDVGAGGEGGGVIDEEAWGGVGAGGEGGGARKSLAGAGTLVFNL